MNLLADARDIMTRTGAESVLVAFSGGKDSFAILDLCVRHFKKVQAFFWYWIKGLRCEETFIRLAEKRWGLKIERFPHYNLFAALRGAAMMPAYRQTTNFPAPRQAEYEAWLRKKFGVEWIAYGSRCQDSLERVAQIRPWKGVDLKTHRFYPIAEWKTRDVVSYLRIRKIPLPDMFGGRQSGGVSYDPVTVEFLRKKYPDDLKRIMRVFPHVKFQLERERAYGTAKERAAARKTSAVPSPADVEEGSPRGAVQPA